METVSQEVRKILKKTLPESVEVKVSTFMDDIRESQALEFKLRGIVLFFSVVVLVISLLGVYSAVTIDTEYRRCRNVSDNLAVCPALCDSTDGDGCVGICAG